MSDQATTGNDDFHMDVDEHVVSIDSSTVDVNKSIQEAVSDEKGPAQVADEV